ncbi:MAG: hypothetical protein FWE70_04670, partial [Oscillospiraceae bacterium]|nr:hypothetical protein [Oscillospiraceae bacterium]
MKLFKALPLSLIILLSSFAFASCGSGEDGIEFADDNFKKGVMTALSKTLGGVTYEEAESLTSLTLSSTLTTIEDIVHFPNLTRLTLTKQETNNID